MKSLENSVQYEMKSDLGPLYVVATDQGLRALEEKKLKAPLVKTLDSSIPAHQHILKTVKQLEEYFEGKRTRFQLKFDLVGTPFQMQVWEALQEIPYGKTTSYQEIATRIHKPKACRAVGSANGKNPIFIIIPCHRVITSGGKLGGYAGGLAMKRFLLNLEQGTPSLL